MIIDKKTTTNKITKEKREKTKNTSERLLIKLKKLILPDNYILSHNGPIYYHIILYKYVRFLFFKFKKEIAFLHDLNGEDNIYVYVYDNKSYEEIEGNFNDSELKFIITCKEDE